MAFFNKIFKKSSREPISIKVDSPSQQEALLAEAEPSIKAHQPWTESDNALLGDSITSGGRTPETAVEDLPLEATTKIDSALPLVDERAELKKSWKEIMDLREEILQGFSRVREIEESLKDRDRLLFEQLQLTHETLGEAFDELTGKSHEKTMDEVNDLLAVEIGKVDVETGARSPADIAGLLALVREKSQAVKEELGSFLSRARNTLSQVSSLKQQKEAQLALLERQVGETQHAHNRADELLRSFKTERKRLESDIESMIASRQNFETQVSLTEEKIQRIMEDKESLEDKSSDLRKEKDDLLNRLEEARREAREIENTVDGLRSTLQALEHEKENLELQLRNLRKEKDHARQDVQMVEKSREDHLGSQQRINSEIEMARRRIENLKAEYEEVKGSRELIHRERQEFEESAGQQASQLEELERTLTSLAEERAQLEEVVEKEKEELRQVQEEAQQQQEKTGVADENVTLIQAEISAAQEEITNLNKQKEEVESQRKTAKKDLASLEHKEKALPSLEEANAKLAAIREERDKLVQDLLLAEEEIQAMKDESKRSGEALADKIRAREAVGQGIQDAEGEIAQLKEHLTETRRTMADLEETSKKTQELAQEVLPSVAEPLIPAANVPFEVESIGTLNPPVTADEKSLGEHKRAIRLANVLVSDLIQYNKEALRTAANQRNFYEIFDQTIRRSEEYFREKIPAHVIQERDYLKEALEKLRQGLKP